MAKGPIDWNTAAWLKIRWNYENQHYEFHSLPDCNDFICADLFFVRRGNHNEPIDEFTNIYTFSNLLTPGSPTKQRMNFWDWSMFSQYPWCVGSGTISCPALPPGVSRKNQAAQFPDVPPRRWILSAPWWSVVSLGGFFADRGRRGHGFVETSTRNIRTRNPEIWSIYCKIYIMW